MTDNAGDYYNTLPWVTQSNDTNDAIYHMTTGITTTSNLANCLSCGTSYDPLIGHNCPNAITTRGTTVTGGYCDKCTLWYQGLSHTCDISFTIQPLLGLEQRYFFHMKDLV